MQKTTKRNNLHYIKDIDQFLLWNTFDLFFTRDWILKRHSNKKEN